MTLDQITRILLTCGVNVENTHTYSILLLKGFEKFNVNDFTAQCNFIANAVHESAKFTTLQENLNYSVSALTSVFGKRINQQQANQFGYIKDKSGKIIQKADKVAIANIVYAGRFGNKNAGDGWLYSGKGIFQLTFKDNYRAFAKFSDIDVVNNPELLLKPEIAVESALWFFTSKGLHKIKDPVDVRKTVNGGINGMDDVISMFNKIIKIEK